MKRKFTFLIAAAVMLLTMMATTGTMWGQTYTWNETAITDLATGDYVVIVGTVGTSKYAMSNDKGTSAAPTATAVTVSNGQLSGTIGDAIQWEITVTTTTNNNVTTTSYKFGKPATTISDYLYCTNTNNGVRVGTNNNNSFTYISGGTVSNVAQANYLFNTATSRYIGVYNSADWRCYTSVNNNIKDQSFAFYKRVEVQTEDPYIIADDVEIAYNATEGSIAYELQNATGNVTAEVTTGGDWLELGTITATEVPFTCSANSTTVARTATVTLSFTDAEDKVVTITQAAAPLTTMDAIFAAATSAGSTATSVYITLNNWVVSGISTNGKNVFVTDGTKGFVLFDNGGSMGFATDNILSGTVSCKVQLYNGFAEITQLNSTTTGISVTTGGTVSPADVEMADLTGVNTGALLHYENLTCSVDNNKYYLTDGTTTLQVYNALYAFGSTFVAGHVYNITGVYQQFNTTKEILPRSADDIEVVETEVADPVFSPEAGTYATTQTVTMSCTTEGAAIHYTTDGTEPDENSDVYTTGISVSETTTFKAKAIKGDDASAVITATYHICSAENPYTVAQALAFNEYPTSTIWVHGIVSTAPTAAPNNGQLTYYISDNGEATNQLQVYKGKGLNNVAYTAQDDIQVGDIVTITGIVKIYNTTTEFDAGNYLTSFERPTPPVEPAITVNSTLVETTADATEGTLTVAYENIDFTIKPEVVWYESDGTTVTTDPEWMVAEINNDNNVYYMISENDGDARTAYFKVYGLDSDANDVYSDLVTINQAAAPQNFDLTIEPFENLELITFVDDQVVLEEDGTIQVTSGAQVMLSIVADDGYVIETLMVNGVDHAADIDANEHTYSFDMPGENVTISATAVEYIPPVVGNYVRINDISYLTDGAKVIIAARYDEDNTNKYYAMTNASSGKPTGVEFTSTTANTFEVLPSDITNDEDAYYWTVGITENGYTFTNSNDELIGYSSSTSFATGGNNTEWNIEFGTSEATAMVANYEAFTITNHNQNNRGFALNSSHNFGPYAISNNTSGDYNFYLDFFVQGAEPVVTPSISLSSYEINAPASETIEILTITPANIENFDVDNLSADYCNADGSEIEGSKPDFVEFDFSENEGYKLTCTIANNTGEARTAYFKVKYDNGGTDVVSNVVTVNQAEYVAPVATITVYPTSVSATAAETEDYLAITLDNIVITEEGNGEFDLIFCDSEGEPLPDQSNKPEWFAFEFSFNDVWSMPYTISANTETTARTLYCKVKGTGDDGTTVAYSELVTVTQAAFVIDYATLPFEWEGGTTANFNALNGASTYSVGDYGENHGVYRMKLDGTGDYIQVKTNEQPGVVTIGVKMIGGATTSTLTVQGSADGETFINVEALTISGSQNTELTLETTNNFAATDRYVRLLFTKGSNVGVGPITIAQVDLTPSVSLNTYSIEATSAATNGNLTATYNNIDNVVAGVAYYESDGTTSATYDWFTATINATDNTVVNYVITENDGEERTAYFKVYATVNDENVYSELVTVTQAANIPPVPTTTYTLASSIESGLHYIITNGTDKAMGVQNNNNRAAVAITIENDATTIAEDAGVYEIVINGPDANGNYTIYDKQYPGYLYAASSSSNHLKTRESNSDKDSQWTIEFEAAGNVIITATGNNTRNLMRYNTSSTCFSCYDANNSQQNIYLYVKENDTDYEYYGMTMTYTETSIPAGETITVGAGSVMTVPNNFVNNDPTVLVIGEGGQLVTENDVEATLQKEVTAYTARSGDGWYLIASPVEPLATSVVAHGTYDLFTYDEEHAYWYSNTGTTAPFTELHRGQGYLYANASDVDLNYAGTMKATNSNINVDLSYTESLSTDVRGFNLVGNPFTRNLVLGDMELGGSDLTQFYIVNNAHTGLTSIDNDSYEIKPGEGFFVQATAENQKLTFNPTSKGLEDIKFIKIVAGNENGTDNAYINLSCGNTLRKMNIANLTSVYVMDGDDDYAAARIEDIAGTMPIHFEAVADGEYTITIEAKHTDAHYMHLLDNFTGDDIDLLVEPSYTFNATTNDNADRFRLVFDFNNYTGVDENYTGEIFAYQNGNDIYVNGNGELQVFDVMGRMVATQYINGVESVNVKLQGVYIFRLNGNTQKIVVR